MDWLKIYYKVDGSQYMLIDRNGALSTTNMSSSEFSGAELGVMVDAHTTGNDEYYYVHDICVEPHEESTARLGNDGYQAKTGISPGSVAIYPNPTENILTIECNNVASGNYPIVLTKITGKTILEKQVMVTSERDLYQLDVDKIKPGIYVLKLIMRESVFSRKILIN